MLPAPLGPPPQLCSSGGSPPAAFSWGTVPALRTSGRTEPENGEGGGHLAHLPGLLGLFPPEWPRRLAVPPALRGGGRGSAAHLLGPRQAGRHRGGPFRRNLSAAALPLPTRALGAHRRWDICILAPVPLERLLPQAGRPSSSWLHSCCSDYISNKNLLTMQVGSCIPLQVSLAPPCSPRGSSQTPLMSHCCRRAVCP